ncbi:hypothetical protein LLE49_26170 [Alicyclobacillus tolerans]|uniref:hypothetical protein n=1 Tax=Alicyclobacillus tolerans TaxID=90970 RepID=UPI001F3667EF|nr:hypothetical protein [Alicyclobacillus tolerans]MCF8568213.1 hypothetical protein [Alicyclobacillus tolerans]
MSAEEISSKKQKYHDVTTRMNMSIEYDTVKYQIGILKIIYELACYWLGSVYVQTDDTAKLLRECVWDKAESIANYEIRGQIGNAQGSPIGAMFSKATDMHIGCLVQSGNDLAIYVRVFNTFEGTVAVSSHASNFVKSQDTLLRAVVIDPVKGDIHEGDFLEIMRKFT